MVADCRRFTMYPIIDEPHKYTAALYLRLSKEDKQKGTFDNSESIKNQKALLEGYAQEQRLTVYDIYIDDGYSGTNDERPNFERMIDDIESKKINMVITKDLSRLCRNYIDGGYYLEEYFPEQRVRYISLLDGVDTGARDYTGDITPFRNIMNDYYARDISKKITCVKRDKQKKGLFIGGKAPYGYKKSPTEKNHIVIDEDVVDNVRYMFDLALEGKSCREIAMTLNRKNIPTPAQYAKINLSIKGHFSGKWSAEQVSFMLQNEVYIGSMVQGRVQKASYKSKKSIRLPKEDWTVVENTHEPIIDRATFEKVATLIKSRGFTRSRTYDYLLKGLIHCHECGHPLGVLNRPLAGNIPTLYFVCRTYQRFTEYHYCTCHCIKVDTVTEAVLKQVREICQRYIDQIDIDKLTYKAQAKLQAEKRKQGKDLAGLRTKLSSICDKLDKAYEDKLSGSIDDAVFQRVYTKLKGEHAETESKIKTLESSSDTVLIDSKKVKSLVRQFLDAEEYSRELIVSLIDRVELTENKDILVYYKFKELDLS